MATSLFPRLRLEPRDPGLLCGLEGVQQGEDVTAIAYLTQLTIAATLDALDGGSRVLPKRESQDPLAFDSVR